MSSSSMRVVLDDITGFQRDLRDFDRKLETDFERIANKKVAELVATTASANFSSLGGVASKVAPSVKALAQARSAAVQVKETNTGRGSPLPPHGPEFGGGLHGPGNPTARGGHTTQFLPHRGSGGGAGYGVFEAIRKRQREIPEIYGDVLENVARKSFPD